MHSSLGIKNRSSKKSKYPIFKVEPLLLFHLDIPKKLAGVVLNNCHRSISMSCRYYATRTDGKRRRVKHNC